MLASATARFSGDLPIPLNVGYTKNKQYLIQALVSSQLEYEATWLGLNSVDNGNPLKGKYFRIKFSPTSGFGRHGGDDFASLTLSGTVLADPNRGSATESAYHETVMI